MKIALVNTLYAPYQTGGTERAVQILAEGLHQRGHSVSVITLGGDARNDCSDVLNGVTVYRLPLRNWYWPYSGFVANAVERAAWHVRDFHNAAMSDRVGKLLDDERPDILHTNGLAGFSVGIWGQATRRLIPVVHTLHDHYLMCPPAVMYTNGVTCEHICARCLTFAAYRRRASRAVHAAVGVSRYILDRHIREGFFKNAGTTKVVFNSVRSARRQRQRSRKGPLAFGFIGRLVKGKGVRWLLETFTGNADPGHRLVIAGEGEPAVVESLKAEFASPSVAFIGHVDPAVFYEQVDVVVAPSLWNEAFGRTAIEALAYAIPVIASNRGGLPEAIQDGLTGLIVDPDVPGSLAQAMRRFSAEPELASRLGGNGAQRLSRFSEECALDAYESVYADVTCSAESASAFLASTRSTSGVRPH
jgi:glycosyltransferase involved in cell wall biosynthesis